MLPVSAAPTNQIPLLSSRVGALAVNVRTLHASARGRRFEFGRTSLDSDSASAIEICAIAIPHLTTLGESAANVERLLAAPQSAASRSASAHLLDEFAPQVVLADLALVAHARTHRLDRVAHRDEVSLVTQAEICHVATRIDEGHERGYLAPPIAALAESLAQAIRCADHDSQTFRSAAVDWNASALSLYAIATLVSSRG